MARKTEIEKQNEVKQMLQTFVEKFSQVNEFENENEFAKLENLLNDCMEKCSEQITLRKEKMKKKFINEKVAERNRLQKEIDKLNEEITKLKG